MKPNCYDRSEYTDPRAGWHETGRMLRQRIGTYPRFKLIYRYRWPWFTDRCTLHEGTGVKGPAADHASYAVAHGFDCRGCRWLPEGQ